METFVANIEEVHNIKFVFLIKTGSYIWGMRSKQSILDIRGVYFHKDPIKRTELFLDHDRTQCIEAISKDTSPPFHWVIWELTTFLRDFFHGNPVTTEWLFTDSAYCTYGRDRFRSIQANLVGSNGIIPRATCTRYRNLHIHLIKVYYHKYVDPKRNSVETKLYESICQENAELSRKLISISDRRDLLKNIEECVHRICVVRSQILRLSSYTRNSPSVVKDTESPANVKYLLYVLRSVLSLEYSDPVPTTISDLLEESLLDTSKKDWILSLLNKRSQSDTDVFEMCPSWLSSKCSELESVRQPVENDLDLRKCIATSYLKVIEGHNPHVINIGSGV